MNIIKIIKFVLTLMGMVCSTPKYKESSAELTIHQITTDFHILELSDQPIKIVKLITSPPKP